MIPSFKFGRLDRTNKVPNFRYELSDNANARWTPRDLEMRDLGAHYSVSIKNYMREDVILVDSLRTEPKRISSIYSNDKFMLEDTNNFVVIEIRMRENDRDKDGNSRIKTQTKVEIKCPGHLLQTQSLFVEELGCYVTVQSRLLATRELIGHDSRFPDAKDVSVPESMVKPDPVNTFRKYESLVKNCIERTDKIQVRVGIRPNCSPALIPDCIKNMRIAVMDRDFSPYYHNRMIYDPTLDETEFVVENLHLVSSEPLISTFERLSAAEGRAFFIDTQEHHSMGGILCGLVIFADPDALADYLFAHKSEELYNELTDRLIDKNGSPTLKRQIKDLETTISDKETQINDLDLAVKFERDQNRTLKRMVTAHEDTIKKIQTNHEPALAYEAVMSELSNEREKLQVERNRLEFDRHELEVKLASAKAAQKVGMLKTIGEILKSTWGIILAMITIGTAIFQGWKKLKFS